MIDYKDSDEALFEQEQGNPQEDVEVTDHLNNGKTLIFIWNRGKSNENVIDTGVGKAGFSFYYARYAYRDPYLLSVPELARSTGNTAILGMITTEDERVMLVIQARNEAKDRIRIVSAYYETREKVELKYYKHAFNIKNQTGNIIPHAHESTNPSAAVDALREWKKRSLSEN